MVVSTPCKINLHLAIHHEKDGRGYHLVDTVMVPVGIYDVISVQPAEDLIVRHTPAIEAPPETTTVWRAATLLARELGVAPEVCIEVERHIPEQAGLGGSSADAGAALRALAEFWGVDALDPRVVGVARRVGADVAFFLDPRPSSFGGVGDVREGLVPSPELCLALVMPAGAGVSTQEAYEEFDRSGTDPTGCDKLLSALREGDVAGIGAHLFNNLAAAAETLCPEVVCVEEWLRSQAGVVGVQVSGSGSCSFAICDSEATAEAIAASAHDVRRWRAWAAKTVGLAGRVC